MENQDIWQLILGLLDLKSQLDLMATCASFYQYLDILDLSDERFIKNLDDNILSQPKFARLTKLSVQTPNITSIKHLTRLRILHINGKNSIGQNEIVDLKLVELNANFNEKIIDVSFMTTLKILYARGTCGINQNGIANLDLILLDVAGNSEITDVSFMKSLRILGAWFLSGIDQNGIKNLDLIYLATSHNPQITSVNHMKQLRYLYATNSGITQKGIDRNS